MYGFNNNKFINMEKLKNLLFVVMFVWGFTTSMYAYWDHPEANFGIYGIQHFATIAQYRQTYVGQVVQYIPQDAKGSYNDTEYFVLSG